MNNPGQGEASVRREAALYDPARGLSNYSSRGLSHFPDFRLGSARRHLKRILRELANRIQELEQLAYFLVDRLFGDSDLARRVRRQEAGLDRFRGLGVPQRLVGGAQEQVDRGIRL